MVIAKYIGDLLFDYECVVIPGLGGFIINDKPSTINYNTNYFTPPFREIMFNPYLLANDGLLLNYIAKEENITYQEAKQKVDNFVVACLNALNNGKRIKFNKVGTISKDSNDKIVFEQDESVNYNPASFGLTSFISPSVRKPTHEETIKKVFTSGNKKEETKEEKKTIKRQNRRPVVDREKTTTRNKVVIKNRRSPYRGQLVFVALLVFAMMAGYVYMNHAKVKYYYDAHAYKLPFLYSNTGAYIANNVEVIPVTKIADYLSDLWIVKQLEKIDFSSEKEQKTLDKNFSFKEEKTEKAVEKTTLKDKAGNQVTSYDEPVVEEEIITESVAENNPVIEEPSKEKEVISEEITTVAEDTPSTGKTAEPVKPAIEHAKPTFSYYIIAGSFKDERNAQNFIRKLKQQGYDAVIAGVSGYGMTRVAYAGYSSRKEALSHLNEIRSKDNPSAWIMRK
jgi:cell division septation protein DedD